LLVRVLASTIAGIDALPVEVETDISKGLPSCTIVGLPGGAVRESTDRVRTAIRNSGFPFPGRRITINLAPADVKKDGALLDLPIALSLLCAEGLVPANALGKYLVGGELSLDGSVRPVRGVLSQALLAREKGLSGIIVPSANREEAALVPGLAILPAETLRDAVGTLSGQPHPPPREAQRRVPPAPAEPRGPDLQDVVGQLVARRALEIAAAGRHALLLSGPPGCGKTMLAERMPGILPDFDGDEALEEIHRRPPDLVILDLTLPGLTGMDICRYMRHNRRTKKIPIIMLTARTAERDRLEGLKNGANRFITKPFSIRNVLAHIQDLATTKQSV